MDDGSAKTVLLVRAGAQRCALALRDVIETMRPLAVAPLRGVPPFVAGVATVRGEPAPVVVLQALLGGGGGAAASRFVLVRAGERRAVLAVDEVIGVAAAPDAASVPLLTGAADGVVSAIGAVDRELLAVLDAARLVPEETWRAMSERGDA